MIREPLLLKLSQVPRSERVHAFIALASLRAVRGEPAAFLVTTPSNLDFNDSQDSIPQRRRYDQPQYVQIGDTQPSEIAVSNGSLNA